MGEDEERLCAQTRNGGHEANGDSGASLDPARERKYAELFTQLDLNKDGRVDINELRIGLAARGLHQGEAEEVRPLLLACSRQGGRLMLGQVHPHFSYNTRAKPPANSVASPSALFIMMEGDTQ